MKQKFQLGQKVTVNTGGNDTTGYIDHSLKNIHGYYWEEQNLYLVRFTDNPDKLLCNGAMTVQDWQKNNLKGNCVFMNAQYIDSKYITPAE